MGTLTTSAGVVSFLVDELSGTAAANDAKMSALMPLRRNTHRDMDYVVGPRDASRCAVIKMIRFLLSTLANQCT